MTCLAFSWSFYIFRWSFHHDADVLQTGRKFHSRRFWRLSCSKDRISAYCFFNCSFRQQQICYFLLLFAAQTVCALTTLKVKLQQLGGNPMRWRRPHCRQTAESFLRRFWRNAAFCSTECRWMFSSVLVLFFEGQFSVHWMFVCLLAFIWFNVIFKSCQSECCVKFVIRTWLYFDLIKGHKFILWHPFGERLTDDLQKEILSLTLFYLPRQLSDASLVISAWFLYFHARFSLCTESKLIQSLVLSNFVSCTSFPHPSICCCSHPFLLSLCGSSSFWPCPVTFSLSRFLIRGSTLLFSPL